MSACTVLPEQTRQWISQTHRGGHSVSGISQQGSGNREIPTFGRVAAASPVAASRKLRALSADRVRSLGARSSMSFGPSWASSCTRARTSPPGAIFNDGRLMCVPPGEKGEPPLQTQDLAASRRVRQDARLLDAPLRVLLGIPVDRLEKRRPLRPAYRLDLVRVDQGLPIDEAHQDRADLVLHRVVPGEAVAVGGHLL